MSFGGDQAEVFPVEIIFGFRNGEQFDEPIG